MSVTCGNCGMDLTNWPINAAAHQCYGVAASPRTPDLTEALARLKALEERLRMGCGERHQTVLAVPEGYSGDVPFGCECSMADEVAAIREAMGATD